MSLNGVYLNITTWIINPMDFDLGTKLAADIMLGRVRVKTVKTRGGMRSCVGLGDWSFRRVVLSLL